LAPAVTVTDPEEPVAATPVTETTALATMVTVPTEPVADSPVTDTYVVGMPIDAVGAEAVGKNPSIAQVLLR